jgi:GNAT superfamily N-acetyltransferase
MDGPPVKLPELEIRRAEPADAQALTTLAHAAKRRWGYPEDLIALWRADLTVTPEIIRAHPVYCAVSGSEVLGFYALSHDEVGFELEHMWVDPRYMRGGLGRLLFQHAVNAVRSLGGCVLKIASDPNAEGFYRRMGARSVGTVPSNPPGRELPRLVWEEPDEAGGGASL